MKVYCAGKIAKNDWRHCLFDLCDTTTTGYDAVTEGIYPPSFSPVIRGDLEYGGPFFVSCDHGCFHGSNEHGLGALASGCANVGKKANSPAFVQSLCLRWVHDSDLMFVWLNDPTAHGTLVEIGFAAAFMKPIWLYYPTDAPEDLWGMWFARETATQVHSAPDPVAAFQHFEERAAAELQFARRLASATRDLVEYLRGSGVRPRAITRGQVYVLRMGDVFKIGKTYQLDTRIKALSVQLPYKAEIEHTVRTDNIHAAERFLHRLFQPYRLNGEWFQLPEYDLNWLLELRNLETQELARAAREKAR